MKVRAIDVGGKDSGHRAKGTSEVALRPALNPKMMVQPVKTLAADWQDDVVSIGIHAPCLLGHMLFDPHNLAPEWIGFDFKSAFGCPVKMTNDAAIQALGSYKRAKIIFLGLGTGLGAALVVDGVAESRELARLPFKEKTYEDCVGRRGLEKLGKKRWRKNVDEIVTASLT